MEIRGLSKVSTYPKTILKLIFVLLSSFGTATDVMSCIFLPHDNSSL
jgi:hypothetical protein